MSTYQLGDRVTMTGTAAKRKNASPETWDEAPLPKLDIYPTPRIYSVGIIVGKRTVMDGWTDGGWDEPISFTPKAGTQKTVWLVAFDLRRKPVMCFDHQISLKESTDA